MRDQNTGDDPDAEMARTASIPSQADVDNDRDHDADDGASFP